MSTPYTIGARVWPGLAKLIEEMGEAAQVAGKIIAVAGAPHHWDEMGALPQRLMDELGDVLAAANYMITSCDLDEDYIIQRMETKSAQFWHWHQDERARDASQID